MIPGRNSNGSQVLRLCLLVAVACGVAACGARGKPFAAATPPTNHALIHVYRPQRGVGGANRWYLSANGRRLTTITNGGYFTYEAEPGNVTFGAKLRPSPAILYLDWFIALVLREEELITITVEANQGYFVRFNIGPTMELVDTQTGEDEIRDLQAFDSIP